ncbi:MAG: Ribose-phosphate pyrophosphokinase [candidate division TM6 bacterium GW2011_GWF2_38_10]|nr:MAG: Ribose-phosphate pyrophosphokinase [candidate division TM6 bacterium GW2011_GWF2_38_10]
MNKEYVIGICAPQDSLLGATLCAAYDAPLYPYHLSWFANGEPHIAFQHLDTIDCYHLFIVFQWNYHHATNQHISVNDQAMALLFLIHALRTSYRKKITLILPYIPYTRNAGKDIMCSCNAWAQQLFTAGADHIITCDIHSPASAHCFGEKITTFATTPFWKTLLTTQHYPLQKLCIVSPDTGGAAAAQSLSKQIGCSYAQLHKHRPSKNTCVITHLEGVVDGMHCVIFDDMLDTGNTAVKACLALLEHGALSVTGCFTHGIFSPHAYHLVANAPFSQIFLSNTILGIQTQPSHITCADINHFFVQEIIKGYTPAQY